MKLKLLSLSLFLLLICVPLASSAQKKDDSRRNQWNKEMTQAKVDFIAGQLGLTADKKAKFVETYNAMQSELGKLRNETNSLRKSIEAKKSASDLEYEKAAEAMFEFKQKEGAIERKYFDKFKSILTPRQLFQLRPAEMKFMKELMKHRKK